jgi:hypothetical protein
MPEAAYIRGDETYNQKPASTLDGGQVLQLPTGEAAFLDSGSPAGSADYTDDIRQRGKVLVAAATGVQMVAGQRVYWDYSANLATYRKVNDRDFYLGILVQDKASGDNSATVDLNKLPRVDIDLARDFFDTVLVGTQAAGGFNEPRVRGGGRKLILSATSEAQKIDLFSRDRFDKAANAVVEAVFTLVDNGAGAAPDFSIGIANATHATNASAITERCFVHLDGNALDLYAESGDGTTTVALTDTTVDAVEGGSVANRIHVVFDLRDPADVQIIVNGALVLSSTVFDVSAGAGPWGLLAHLEKTSAADIYEIDVERFVAWYSEQ